MLKTIFTRLMAIVAVAGLVATTGCKDNAEAKPEITEMTYNPDNGVVTITGKNFGTSSDAIILFRYAGSPVFPAATPATAAPAKNASRTVMIDEVEYEAYSPASITDNTITVSGFCFWGRYDVLILTRGFSAKSSSPVQVTNCD